MRRDQVLIDYLLNALSPEQRQQVEDRLHADAAWAARLEQLRRRLRPLERERRAVVPPAGLARRTIQALHRLLTHWPSPAWLATVPRAPQPDREAVAVPVPRRADVIIAASILLISAGLVSSAIGKIRMQSHWVICQNALRDAYSGWLGSPGHPARTVTTAERVVTDPLVGDTEPRRWSQSTEHLFATAISSQIITMCNCQECVPIAGQPLAAALTIDNFVTLLEQKVPIAGQPPAAAHRRERLLASNNGFKRAWWDGYPDGNPFRPHFMTPPAAVPTPVSGDNGYLRVVAAYGIMPFSVDVAAPMHLSGSAGLTAAFGPELLRGGGHCLFRDGHVVRNPATCVPPLP